MAQVVEVSFESHLDEFEEAAQQAALRWLEAVGEDASHTAAKKAPVDTGRLKNSISWVVEKYSNTVYIGTNVHYAKWHEFGTGTFAEKGEGRKTPWAFQDKKGKWHYTHGVPAKHFIQFGATAHVKQYMKWLEQVMKGQR